MLCKFKKFWFSCPIQFRSSHSKISFPLPLAGLAFKFNLGPRICLARQDVYLHRKRPRSQTDSCELVPSFTSSTKVFKPSLWGPVQALGGALWKGKVDYALELMDLICLESRLLSGVSRQYTIQAVAAQFHSIPIARRVNASLDNIDGVSEQAVHSNVRTPGPLVQHADLNAFYFHTQAWWNGQPCLLQCAWMKGKETLGEGQCMISWAQLHLPSQSEM